MHIYDSNSCCAIKEISELSGQRNAEQAMITFVKRVTGNRYNAWAYMGDYFQSLSSNLSAFYMFTSVESVKTKSGLPPRNLKIGYGSKFAAYIRENNLGELVESPSKPNRLNHRTHIVTVWIWTPDKDNLIAWAKARGIKVTR